MAATATSAAYSNPSFPVPSAPEHSSSTETPSGSLRSSTTPPPIQQARRASEAPPSQYYQQTVHPPPSTAALARQNIRRRGNPVDGSSLPVGASKIGPQRTTKNVQKLKILPSPDQQDEESGREVYSQVTRIKDSTARRDAERLGKAERAHLPRVTAYCTANAYKMDGLLRYLKARAHNRGTAPRQFDECIYTPYSYTLRGHAEDEGAPGEGDTHEDLIDLGGNALSDTTRTGGESGINGQQQPPPPTGTDTDALLTTDNANHDSDEDDRRSVLSIVKSQPPNTSEVFLFSYGVVVLWGMTVSEEKQFLKEIARFETEKLSDDDVQVENFNYYITNSYQQRIYNDFITLKDGRNYMVKVAISHAIAQSVKISLFEDLVENTIEETKGIPQEIATTGKVSMGRRTIMMHIGELFILRININLQGSVLDSPELMWSEPELEPTYAAARSYLEINQRVSLLNQRLDVIGDLLQMLKEQLSHAHGEYLEWIVIILIAAEIFVGLVNIAVDILADGAD